MIVDVSTYNWTEEVETSKEPVLVSFSADWCGACRNFRPVLEQIANTLQGKVKVALVNADRSASLLRQYTIRALPSILLFVNGVEVPQARVVGGRSENFFLNLIREHTNIVLAIPPGAYNLESPPVPPSDLGL